MIATNHCEMPDIKKMRYTQLQPMAGHAGKAAGIS